MTTLSKVVKSDKLVCYKNTKKLESPWTFLLLTLIAVTDQMRIQTFLIFKRDKDYILCPGVFNNIFLSGSGEI